MGSRFGAIYSAGADSMVGALICRINAEGALTLAPGTRLKTGGLGFVLFFFC